MERFHAGGRSIRGTDQKEKSPKGGEVREKVLGEARREGENRT